MFKCKKCGSTEFNITDHLDTEPEDEMFSELWKCQDCGEYHKMYYKRERFVRLEEL